MFLRAKVRNKDGKPHRYFSVVENRRVGTQKRTVQRTVLYLGEINDSQEEIWRKTLAVFDETEQRYTNLLLQRKNVVLTATIKCHPSLQK
ncbi:MAG TPA: hypothetical protein VI636_09320 [Candidatus Angelobacter sp.]